MTREEALNKAIGVLTYNQVNFCKSKEAVANMNEIIEALEKIDQEPCGDAVSRLAAIVALDDRMSSLENVDMQIAMGFAKGIIHELPPVTPQPCGDAISRQAVLDTLTKTSGIRGDALKALYDLPSVTAHPKMGRWKAFTHSAYHGNDEDGEPIWREVTVYHCNLCNRRTVIRENYCPNCGAEMRGDAE